MYVYVSACRGSWFQSSPLGHLAFGMQHMRDREYVDADGIMLMFVHLCSCQGQIARAGPQYIWRLGRSAEEAYTEGK
jgi:hypothetical protein